MGGWTGLWKEGYFGLNVIGFEVDVEEDGGVAGLRDMGRLSWNGGNCDDDGGGARCSVVGMEWLIMLSEIEFGECDSLMID